MQPPIVIAALGTSATALSTYTHVTQRIAGDFPGHEIIWCYSSRGTATPLQQAEMPGHLQADEALRQLAARGVGKAVVQPLFLLPGSEFHDFQKSLQGSPVACSLGMPLLAAPDDYHEVGEVLRPAITARPTKAILLIGHGTTHPTWTAYYSLEKILRRTFGERIFVGVIEKFPDSKTLPAEIKAAGFTEVCIIPCLLVAGMHYRRDIAGTHPTSWLSRLQACNLAVELMGQGLGLFAGMDKIISRHIATALARATTV